MPLRITAGAAHARHQRWMADEMMIIPHYIMFLIPILTVWWTHRRGARKEYGILAASVLIVCLALLVYSRFERMTRTGYHIGILTAQMPFSVFVAASLAAIPIKWKLVRNFVAVLVGEILLLDTWVS